LGLINDSLLVMPALNPDGVPKLCLPVAQSRECVANQRKIFIGVRRPFWLEAAGGGKIGPRLLRLIVHRLETHLWAAVTNMALRLYRLTEGPDEERERVVCFVIFADYVRPEWRVETVPLICRWSHHSQGTPSPCPVMTASVG